MSGDLQGRKQTTIKKERSGRRGGQTKGEQKRDADDFSKCIIG